MKTISRDEFIADPGKAMDTAETVSIVDESGNSCDKSDALIGLVEELRRG
ncbi:MAG TPA: hypothetical protein VGK73_31670 [Polyangiaceae bacterium]